MGKVTAEAYKDQYVYGIGGEIGGPPVKIAIEASKTAMEYLKSND